MTERVVGTGHSLQTLVTSLIRREGWRFKNDMANLEDAVNYSIDPLEHLSVFTDGGGGTIFANDQTMLGSLLGSMGPGDSMFGDPHPTGLLSLFGLDMDILGPFLSCFLGFDDLAGAGGLGSSGYQSRLVGILLGLTYGGPGFGPTLSTLPGVVFTRSTSHYLGDLPGLVNDGKGVPLSQVLPMEVLTSFSPSEFLVDVDGQLMGDRYQMLLSL